MFDLPAPLWICVCTSTFVGGQLTIILTSSLVHTLGRQEEPKNASVNLTSQLGVRQVGADQRLLPVKGIIRPFWILPGFRCEYTRRDL